CCVGCSVPATQRALPGDLGRFVQDRLPEYMVPSSFVALERLPLGRHGKLDRAALPPPEQGRPARAAAPAPARSWVEEALADLWAQVLGVEQPGIHDNFFVLGGHSLVATPLMARARALF